jgi:hypothetical protein
MAAAVEAAGFATLNVTYPSRAKPLEALVEGVHEAAAAFWAPGQGPIHIVSHSIGLMRDGAAQSQVVAFLRQGRFIGS